MIHSLSNLVSRRRKRRREIAISCYAKTQTRSEGDSNCAFNLLHSPFCFPPSLPALYPSLVGDTLDENLWKSFKTGWSSSEAWRPPQLANQILLNSNGSLTEDWRRILVLSVTLDSLLLPSSLMPSWKSGIWRHCDFERIFVLVGNCLSFPLWL